MGGEHCWSCFQLWWPLCLPLNGSKVGEGKQKSWEVPANWNSLILSSFCQTGHPGSCPGLWVLKWGPEGCCWVAGSAPGLKCRELVFSSPHGFELSCWNTGSEHWHPLFGVTDGAAKITLPWTKRKPSPHRKVTEVWKMSTQVLLWAELQWLQVSELIWGSFDALSNTLTPYPPKHKI